MPASTATGRSVTSAARSPGSSWRSRSSPSRCWCARSAWPWTRSSPTSRPPRSRPWRAAGAFADGQAAGCRAWGCRACRSRAVGGARGRRRPLLRLLRRRLLRGLLRRREAAETAPTAVAAAIAPAEPGAARCGERSGAAGQGRGRGQAGAGIRPRDGVRLGGGSSRGRVRPGRAWVLDRRRPPAPRDGGLAETGPDPRDGGPRGQGCGPLFLGAPGERSSRGRSSARRALWTPAAGLSTVRRAITLLTGW